MKTVTNDRNLAVKANAKAVLVNNGASYKKLRSEFKQNGDLHMKFCDVQNVLPVSFLKVLQSANVGTVKMKAEGTLGFNRRPTITYHVTVAAGDVE